MGKLTEASSSTQDLGPKSGAVQSQLSGEPRSQPLAPPLVPYMELSRSQKQAPLGLCAHLFWTPARSSLRLGWQPIPSKVGWLPALPTLRCPFHANRLARLNSNSVGSVSPGITPGSPSSMQGPQAHSTSLPLLLHTLQHGHRPCPPGQVTFCLSSQGD